jgi:hypothetical protein
MRRLAGHVPRAARASPEGVLDLDFDFGGNSRYCGPVGTGQANVVPGCNSDVTAGRGRTSSLSQKPTGLAQGAPLL